MDRQALLTKQKKIMDRQDDAIVDMGHDVDKLYNIALAHGQELDKQEEDLNNLDHNVVHATAKLGNTRAKLKKTLEAVSNGKSMCCLMVLIFVIIGLVVILALGI
jgi:t-SNARE complex subunit (syntaxin)